MNNQNEQSKWRLGAKFVRIELAATLIILAGCNSQDATVVMDHGNGLGAEAYAINLRNPDCPSKDIEHRKDGLVVVSIDVDQHGKVEKADVLQSPDKSLSDAALNDTLATSFKMPLKDETQRPMRGKGRLFFYFNCSTPPFKAKLPSNFLRNGS